MTSKENPQSNLGIAENVQQPLDEQSKEAVLATSDKISSSEDNDKILDPLVAHQASRSDRITSPIDPREVLQSGATAWVFVSAALERAAPQWGTLALRRGILVLLEDCAKAMGEANAPKTLIFDAQELLDALNKINWTGPDDD